MINHLLKYYHLQNNFKSASKGQKDKLSMACRKVPLKHKWKKFRINLYKSLQCKKIWNAFAHDLRWDFSKDSEQTVYTVWSKSLLKLWLSCDTLYKPKQGLNESIKRNHFFTIFVRWLTNMHWGIFFFIFVSFGVFTGVKWSFTGTQKVSWPVLKHT